VVVEVSIVETLATATLASVVVEAVAIVGIEVREEPEASDGGGGPRGKVRVLW
jgi:hypothetical protein